MSKPRLARLDRGVQLPLYQQIKNEIAERVRSGTWSSGERLPSENELVEMLGVSRMTIHRALRELTRDNILMRVHGVGTFVAERRPHASLVQLRDIADEIASKGHRHSLDVLALKEIRATQAIAERMGLAIHTPVFHLKALHYQDDVPIQFEDRIINPRFVPDFLDVDFSRQTATGYLVALIKPDEMEHVVQAICPDAGIAKALHIARTEPCLQLSRRTFKGKEVITTAKMIFPGNRYVLGARYATDDYRLM
ncbi:MAG: histidine utilization repressor [marine bacterium B5-7]|nr:MAG: histidine utilization repressor [marine bacterium B5-7]